MGKLERIWIKRIKFGPMDEFFSTELITHTGIKNIADQNGERQVTLVEKESWNTMMNELKKYINPSAKRANMLINGLSLKESTGKIINIGECKIQIYGETKPCERMDKALPGLRKAMQLNWHGGVYGIITQGGTVKINDEVYFD